MMYSNTQYLMDRDLIWLLVITMVQEGGIFLQPFFSQRAINENTRVIYLPTKIPDNPYRISKGALSYPTGIE